MQIPTYQEMFDRAWKGLEDQGWQRAAGIDPETGEEICYYKTDDGLRCAWGHVDPEATEKFPYSATVRELRENGCGLAAALDEDGIAFAMRLQRAHDRSAGPNSMRQRLAEVATDYRLKVP